MATDRTDGHSGAADEGARGGVDGRRGGDTAGMNGEGTGGIWRAAAILTFAAIVPFGLLTAPVIAQQLGIERHLSPSQIGQFFFFELGGMSLASLPGLWWMPRWSWRRVGIAAAITFIVANLASLVVPGWAPLLACRGISALAGGTLMIIALGLAARAANRERLFGLWVVGQLALAAIGLEVLPHLFASIGLAAFFWMLAAFMLLSLPLARGFPDGVPAATAHPVTAAAPGAPGAGMILALGIAAILLFYLGLGGTWTFIAGIGATIGIEPAVSGRILAIASLFGVGGALLATVIAGRVRARPMLMTGYAAMIVATLLLVELDAEPRFWVAACLFKFGWTFVLPFILGAATGADRTGTLANLTNLLIGGGLALAPVLSGRLAESRGFDPMLMADAAMVLASALCLAWMVARAAAAAPTSSHG